MNLQHKILVNEFGRQFPWPAAFDGYDMRMGFDEVSDVMNITLSKNFPLMDEDDFLGHGFNFWKDMTGDDNRFAFFFIGLDQFDNFSPA